MGSENGLKVLGGLYNVHIRKAVQGAVKEMKAEKATGLDDYVVRECLNSGSASVMEWLVRVLNACCVTSMIPALGG